MPDATELHARLLSDARNYDPAAHCRSLLSPYRDILLLWRAKFMSYEQIAATLARHGIKVSPAGVGVYCRKTFSKAELDRLRAELRNASPSKEGPSQPIPPKTHGQPAGRQGPKVARDDY